MSYGPLVSARRGPAGTFARDGRRKPRIQVLQNRFEWIGGVFAAGPRARRVAEESRNVHPNAFRTLAQDEASCEGVRRKSNKINERETGLEPATLSLEF